ncbi:MAG: hypothetical protein GY861_28385 [bacterium]|nr:hypothetical protein [bacterium]
MPRMLPSPSSNFMQRAREYTSGAVQARGAMRPGQTTTTEPPGLTTGGGVSAGVGGAMAGAAYGAMKGTSINPGFGTIVGGIVGLASYYLS